MPVKFSDFFSAGGDGNWDGFFFFFSFYFFCSACTTVRCVDPSASFVTLSPAPYIRRLRPSGAHKASAVAFGGVLSFTGAH